MNKAPESRYKWGELAASEIEGVYNINKSYGISPSDPAHFGHRFTIGNEGTVFALVAGDMGYDATHIVIPRSHITALVEDWPEFAAVKAERDALREALSNLSHLARAHRNAALKAFEMARDDEHAVKVGCTSRADMAKVFGDAADAALQEKTDGMATD